MAQVHARSFRTGWKAEDIDQMMRAPGGFALVVVREATVLGFILCRAIAGEAEVLTLAVDPDARGGGVGRVLVEAALRLAEGGGAQTMFLEVAEDNDIAIRLYEAAGFERVGKRRGYYAQAEKSSIDALVYRRPLNTGLG